MFMFGEKSWRNIDFTYISYDGSKNEASYNKISITCSLKRVFSQPSFIIIAEFDYLDADKTIVFNLS